MRQWLLSTNRKDTVTLYFVFGTWSEIIGTSLRILAWAGHPGALTAYAFIIISFIVIPAIIVGFGNWLVRLTLGAPDITCSGINNIKMLILRPWLEASFIYYSR